MTEAVSECIKCSCVLLINRKMLKKLWLLLLIFVKLLKENGAVTHWIVTETGRIQAYVSRMFATCSPIGYEYV